ncbi:MAG TPA: polysaccharide biosynthesis C-terminal domain-containing protein, partial [Tepidisphaeraceae bacterium]|nr:polysaccharide biosynthesis C-terminal domain-containing protein [Tepidisphaeraceae bacterium]
RELTDFGSECWKMSHWVLSGSLTNFIIGPVYTWNMRFWLGKEMVAINYAVTNVLRLTNPLTSVITSLITPNVVRTKERAGMHHAKMQALRFGLLGAFLLMPYLGFLFVAPTFSLALFYKWTSHVLSWSVLLQITAIGQFIIYISIVSAAFLNAVQKSRLTFRGLVVQSILTLAIGIPLTAKFGLIGAAIGAIIPTVVEIGLHLYWIRHLRDDVESSVVVDVPVMEPATQA